MLPELRPSQFVVIHVMGATCAGKTTIVEHLSSKLGVGTVQVGKMMRAKYPPEHFQGLAAPAHTQVEAMQMYKDGILQAFSDVQRCAVVDGQPRDRNQVYEILDFLEVHNFAYYFVLIHAEHEVREARAREGRKPGGELELAIKRLTSDYQGLYTTITHLRKLDRTISVIDTTKMSVEQMQEAASRYMHTVLAQNT